MADIVRRVSEPMVGQIRLAWWREALADPSGVKGRGEPLVDAMRQAEVAPPFGLAAWVDGWDALIGEPDLKAYASGRGGGLFQALAGDEDVPEWLLETGAVWALWDLSGHARDSALADQAIEEARRRLLDTRPRWPAAWRPMRMAYALARHDVMRGRRAPRSLTPRLYLRVLRLGLTTG
ncbi:hypothetical protein [Sphingobium mellinum]|uniref:hypothetical protein n=1 Tax=Sphingobium mellinum TaxID=1387166 RepID=UPI0030EB23AA